jgi:primosomal protein N' (replication factor Y)
VAAVLHSRLSAGERFDEWRRIRSGKARLVIGARSAVFAPVANLGLIIIDEEHEPSYLSEHNPRYDAREVAAFRASQEQASLLLASATPSILSFAKAQRGDYMLLEMLSRVNKHQLAQVTLVDMRDELRLGNRSIFSTLLTQRLKACLEAGQQAMLFINRRGYAPSVLCRKCGHALTCAHCDVKLTYHQADRQMHCHYCGGISGLPAACPQCGSGYLRPVGVGTQTVEEEFHKLFPGVQTVRLDADTTTGKDAHERLLNRFRSGEARVMIGTQMIAKGLDFPQVTLVGVVLADLTLNMPDYRAQERTFQLLTQVAGRAGRAEMPGEVIIQTYKPEHDVILHAAEQEYRGFFNQEFARRRALLYPPFTMMVRLLVEGPGEEQVREVSAQLKERIVTFLAESGPLKRRVLFVREDAAPIKRIMGRHRAQVLMKILEHKDSKQVLAFLTAQTTEPWPCRVSLEINPASLA